MIIIYAKNTLPQFFNLSDVVLDEIPNLLIRFPLSKTQK